MTCDPTLERLRDYVDRELEAPARAEVEAHLAGCAGCSEATRSERELKELIRSKVKPRRAPAGLAQAITRSIREEASAAPTARHWRLRSWRALSLAAGLLITLSGGLWLAFTPAPKPSMAPSPIARAAVDQHLRRIETGEALAINSQDPARVEEFLAKRLEFKPFLPRSDQSGAVLYGGKLGWLVDRPVACLVFQRQTSWMSLFVMSGKPAEFDKMGLVDVAHMVCAIETFRGFRVVCWRHKGLLYVLVTDEVQRGVVDMIYQAYRG